jgi:hypothetical protein
MNWMTRLSVLALSALLPPGLGASSQAQQTNMSFFVTSVGSGKGGTSAACRVPISTVNNSRRRWEPEPALGAPI